MNYAIGEISDNGIDKILTSSQTYFIHEISIFTVSDIKNTAMMSQLNYLARRKRNYLNKATATLTSVNEIIEKLEKELNNNKSIL